MLSVIVMYTCYGYFHARCDERRSVEESRRGEKSGGDNLEEEGDVGWPHDEIRGVAEDSDGRKNARKEIPRKDSKEDVG